VLLPCSDSSLWRLLITYRGIKGSRNKCSNLQQFVCKSSLLDEGLRNVRVSRSNRFVLGHAIRVRPRDFRYIRGLDGLVTLHPCEGCVKDLRVSACITKPGHVITYCVIISACRSFLPLVLSCGSWTFPGLDSTEFLPLNRTHQQISRGVASGHQKVS
jgi:hypothetical protein